ncbi:MAG TPA: carbamoyl-phosphate synthase [Myxococcaceae bacterium]|nr:carbamoyl-phosphate synthase [Myxococcaceae bacterium]
MPTYGGTLAAVRALGRDGVRVTVAGNEWLAPARWSRHADRVVRCPAPRDPAFLEWLLRFGEREPGHLLHPTSDDLAWILARNEAALSRHFLLFQPPVSTVVSLLDKRRLHQACTDVGVPTLPTWFPGSPEEVERLAPSLPFPLVLKPRTQVFLASWSHGRAVDDARALVAAYRDCLVRDRYLPGPERDFGPLEGPILQAYHPAEHVYSLAGFIDRGGELLGMRASRKIIQRPRGLGVGLLFEDAPLDPSVAEGLVRLCRRTGYFGVFEAEFVQVADRYHLIDFNPRYYGQMQFEISRGLPLPLLVHRAAMGDTAGLARLAASGGAPHQRGMTFSFDFGLRMVSAMRGVLGRATDRDSGRPSGTARIDASADPEDPGPGWVHAMADVVAAVRHPRAFYRANLR